MKSVGLIILRPLGKMICSSLSILCSSNFRSNSNDVLGFRPWMFCVSFIQTFSSGEVFNKKLSIVLLSGLQLFFLSRNNVLVIGDRTQW